MTTTREQIINDAAALFDAGLAIDITHYYGGNDETLKAFFDDSYDPSFEGVLPVANSYPRILVLTTMAGSITKDSSFTINGTTYYVDALMIDQEGITEITLSEDSDG